MDGDKPGIIVLKLGRYAVSTVDAWARMAAVIERRLAEVERIVVVCTALEGVPAVLSRLLEQASRGGQGTVLEELRERHHRFGDALGVDASAVLADDLERLERWAQGIALIETYGPRLEARILSRGAILASRLGAAFLAGRGQPARWVDAAELLVAETASEARVVDRYLDARCVAQPDPELIGRIVGHPGRVIVTAAGMARDGEDDVVLLGLGRDDYSAAILAARCQADLCEFWTGRPGLFSTDPALIPAARLLRRLDYEEAQEIASMGPAPVDPRSVEALRAVGVSLKIASAEHPDMEGTRVTRESADAVPRVKAVAVRKDVLLISMETFGMWRRVGFLSEVFDCFRRHGLSVDLVSTAQANVTVSLDTGSGEVDEARLSALLDDLGGQCRVRVLPGCAAISLIGRGIRAVLHRLGPALEVFEAQRVHLVSQAANDLNLTFVVDEEPALRVVRQLHALLFEGVKSDATFGPSWRDLSDRDRPRRRALRGEWWRVRAEELLTLADDRCPVYVYDEPTLRETAGEISALESVDRVFYAIKANDHPDVLRIFESEGLGFECASIHEVEHVVGLFPDLERGRILFTPNFAPREEYRRALALGVRVTVDSLFPLRMWPDEFAGRSIFIRVDPGVGRGHHAHVKTAGTGSKFGVSISQLDELAEAARAIDLDIEGLHAHSGSGIPNPDAWGEVALLLAEAAERFESVSILDLGGGLGVPAKPGQSTLDVSRVDESLARFRSVRPRFRIWLEPGRFLVARAGVLLARVTQTKDKGSVSYVGVETGMNSIIRPALYGAYHEIVNLTRLDERSERLVNVVGPICETGDTLGYGRRMPDASEGDVILLATAGAYGRVMSSWYNRRPPAGEVVLPSSR